MLLRLRSAAVCGMVALLVIAIAGCGSEDDDKGTGTPLTPEEQADLMKEFGLDVDSAGATLMPFLSTGLSVNSWDGFDCEDLGLPVGALGKVGTTGPFNLISGQLAQLAGNGVDIRGINETIQSLLRTAAAQSEPGCEYDGIKGEWIVEIDTALTVESGGNSLILDMEMHDTIAYSSVSGVKQEQPDASTSRLKHGTALDLRVAITKVADLEDPSTLDGDFDLVLKSHQELTGLNTSVVTLNGGTLVAGDVDLAGKVPDTTGALVKVDLEGSLDLTGGSTNVLVPKPAHMSEDLCPTSGAMGADVTVNFKLAVGGERHTVYGTWAVDVVFEGDGMATVTVQAGSYQETQTTQVCTPTEP